MPKLKEWLFGKKDKKKQLPTISPEQSQIMQLIQQGLTSGQGPFADIFGQFNPQDFQKGVSEPAIKQFQEQILPMVQEKFISGNQIGGSGFRNAALKAGTDLQSQLAQLLYTAKQTQGQNRQRGIESYLNVRPHENVIRGGTEGLIPGAVKGFAQGAGQAAGAAIAG